MTGEEIPIIDAHHHFWDLSRCAQPWLCDQPMIPFRYGDYSRMRHNFLHADYQRATAGHNVVASVTMEAEWNEARLIEESEWIQRLHADHPDFPAAHIARTLLHLPGAVDEISRQANFPFVRGIRHKPTAAPSPDRIDKGAVGGMSHPDWRRGYRALYANGLHFELQAPWWHVEELLDLVAAYPETHVVINHAFLPSDRSPEALAGWRSALRLAASAPQVAIKISGIGLKGRSWSLDDNRPVIRDVIEIFGTDRCLFASNFPVDGLCGSFSAIYSGFAAATADLASVDRRKLFHDNAVRIYRLTRPTAGA